MSSQQKRTATDGYIDPKQRAKAKQLQELFPTWSNDDLLSLLAEVHGDVELAATRISEGHAVQWDSVGRKKEKKPTAGQQQSRDSGSGRGDSRGARGGRGGRGGGPARGGASTRGGRGATGRGGHRETNGHSASNGAMAATPDAWGTSTPKEWDTTAPTTQDQSAPAEAPADDWTADSTTAADSASSVLSSTAATTTPVIAEASEAAKLTPAGKPLRTPMTSKMSWAQIAKPAAKPAPPPPPKTAVAPAPPPPAPQAAPEPVAPEPGPVEEVQVHEEPTTVEQPSWDPEPETSAEVPPDLTADGWTIVDKQPEEPQEVITPAPVPEPVVQQEEPELAAPVASTIAQARTPEAVPSKPVTPVPGSRFGGMHRAHRYKTDQAVVLPSSFGTPLEKVGMQFGSLSLSGDGPDDIIESNIPTTAPAPAAAPPAPELTRPEVPAEPVAPPVVSLPQPTSIAQSNLFQAAAQQQQQQQPPPTASPIAPIAVPASASTPAVTTPSASTFSHQQTSISGSALLAQTQPQQPQGQQQQQAQSQQPQQQHAHQHPNAAAAHLPPHLQHQYSNQGIGSHLEHLQSQSPAGLAHPQTLPQQLQQSQQQLGHTSSYFRGTEQPYFNAPTPPVAGGQEGNYGSFNQQFGGQLGHQGLNQQQGQGFGGGDYGYNDGRASLYESYSQQGGFQNQRGLSHDDVKGIGGQNQQQSSIPSQQGVNSGSQIPQSQSGQQGYQPAPYYPYFPQNQYYGAPYGQPGYGVPQPFVKYPGMYQQPGVPGGPGGGNAATGGKPGSAGLSAQGQNSPYSGNLYANQDYDVGGYQGQNALGSGHHSGAGAGGGGSAYEKQLYGAQGAMQGFMGLSGNQTAASPGGTQLGQRGSPETSYKYSQGVGKAEVAGAGGAVGQQQVRGGVPQSQQGFYGNNRFAGSAQQQTPQGQAQGYPQGAPDGFYNYQGRQQQQQPYWQ